MIRFSGNELASSNLTMGTIKMTEEEELAIRVQIGRLRQQHRDLDAAIDALTNAGMSDPLRVQRLKKQKLQLKDEITALEDTLFPDISA